MILDTENLSLFDELLLIVIIQKIQEFPLSMLIFGHKSGFLGTTIK